MVSLKLANCRLHLWQASPSKNYWIFGFLDFQFRGRICTFLAALYVCVCVSYSRIPDSYASEHELPYNLEKKKKHKNNFFVETKKKSSSSRKREKSKMECTFVLEIGHFMVYTVLGDFPALVLLLVVVMLTDLSVLRLSKILL